MKAYKLTDENGQTHGYCQWGENVTHETDGHGELCGSGWLHFYDDPYLAVLFNPIHAGFNNPQLWEAETGEIIKKDKGLKFGTTKLTTVKKIPLPIITTGQRIEFAIRCAQIVYKNDAWNQWANDWLNGKDRTANAAYAAANAAYAAVDAAADAAAYAAVNAADVAYAADIDFKAIIKQIIEKDAK
jgi:hypothetical protein